MLGWAAKSRLRRVDLPVPEGPEITRGRGGEGRAPMVVVVVVVVVEMGVVVVVVVEMGALWGRWG